MDETPFQIGGFYINRVGRSEVIALDDNAGRMVVCYTSGGAEVELTIDTQYRI